MPKIVTNPKPPTKLSKQQIADAKTETELEEMGQGDVGPREVLAVERPKKEVRYDGITVNGIPIPVESMRISVDMAKIMLRWETEDDYAARMMADNPKLSREQCKFDDSMFKVKDATSLTDKGMPNGNLCTAWHNLDNREFDAKLAMKYAQDILNRCWAGPSTFPDQTINGETIIISREADVESGQHRLVGLIFAGQMWAHDFELDPECKSLHRTKIWQEEPFIEGLYVCGVSSDPRVTATIDNGRGRTTGDSIFTSPLFRDCNRKDRAECSRMMDRAITMLWQRTEMKTNNRWESERTASSVRRFRERHPKIEEAVRFVFNLNKSKESGGENPRCLTNLKINEGCCAAMLYLMAAGETDREKYRELECPGEKNEKGRKVVDFGRWDAACSFWTFFAKASNDPNSKLAEVHNAVTGLVDPDDPSNSGKLAHKMAVLSKAWALFVADKDIEADDLELHYHQDANGISHLDAEDYADFGGIDNADPKEAEAQEKESQEQLAASIAKGRADKAEEHRKMVEESQRRAAIESGQVGPTFDVDGKPPVPKLLKTPLHKAEPTVTTMKCNGKLTQKQVNAAQTAQAAKHDAEDAATKSAQSAPTKPVDQQKLRSKTRG